ncbi:MAG: TlpA disulfide reductase family protein [Sulfuritalea sp.]|jgi:peroxiredoxin|nr:TlpA disulfide reductase family protein [Sulfuritalea sp.]MDP1982466.1 TlpA disulfide reductase family protein [Sulfuritalea sp.]
MKSSRIWITVAVVGVMSAIFGYLVIKYSQPKISAAGIPPVDTTSIGTQASAILRLSLPDADGRTQALEQWRGKILVVNYWATWCPPCREEMPGFARLQEKLGTKGVQFVGISIDTAAKVTEFQKQTPVNYPLLIGDAGAIDSSVALGNSSQGLPFTAVIDRHGMVSAIKLGRFPEADLERQLAGLISR